MKKLFLKPLVVVFTLGVILLLHACSKNNQHPGYEFMPDMYTSSSYETYQASSQFPDSITALTPVAGTIPRGFNTYFPYPNTNEGYEAAGAELKNPLPVNDANLKEGDRLYHTMCQQCHGEKGDGNGTLRIKGEKFPVPSYFDDAHINLPEGKMFFSITYGKNLMGPHASIVNPDERWKIVMYLKSLMAKAIADKSKKPAASADTTAAKTDTTKTTGN